MLSKIVVIPFDKLTESPIQSGAIDITTRNCGGF
jgi:hypothetical protein